MSSSSKRKPIIFSELLYTESPIPFLYQINNSQSNTSTLTGCTAKAVTHRVSKIRNLAKNYVPTNDNGNTGTVSAAGRKRGATKAEVGEAETSPAKKSKSPVKAAVPKAKAKATPIEGDDDDNQDNENGGSNAIKAEE